MRTTLLIIISILVFVCISCDNYEISDKQADSFIKYYGVGMEDEGIRVITTEEGYLIMGTIENPGRGRDICIIQTDKFGNSIEPIRTYGGLFEDNGYAIKPHAGGYVIAGSTRRTEYSDLDIYLVQIDHTGDLVWDSIYGQIRDDEAYDVLVLENGNLVVTGYSENYSVSTGDRKKDILFLKTDRLGNRLKMKYTGTPEDDEAFSILQSGRIYMMAGYSNKLIAGSSQTQKTIYILRWAGEGPMDAAPLGNALPAGSGSWVQTVVSESNNEYYLACNVRESQGNDVSVHVLKIDTLWNILWQDSYGERTINAVSGLAIQNNSLYAVGTSTNETNEENSGDILILKTSLTGENPVYYYTGDGESYLGNGFDFAPDGGYIITGTNFINTKSVITLCKLNAEGTLQ